MKATFAVGPDRIISRLAVVISAYGPKPRFNQVRVFFLDGYGASALQSPFEAFVILQI